MMSNETLRDLFRVAVGTVVCLSIINLADPDLLNVSWKLGENVSVGLVPVILLILGIGGIFWGGYLFCIQCEVIFQVARVRLNARHSDQEIPK